MGIDGGLEGDFFEGRRFKAMRLPEKDADETKKSATGDTVAGA